MPRQTRLIRYAVVGLGHIAQVAVLPAFAHARRNSQLVTVVSDDRSKRQDIAKRYRLDRTFTYDEFDDCLRDGQFDECDLTMRDLAIIVEALERSVATMFHHRIDYPGFDFNREKSRRRTSEAGVPRAAGPRAV